MNPESPAILDRLLRDNDLGWIIDMYTPRERVVPSLLEQLTRLTAEFGRRFGYQVSFAPEVLRAEAERNPHRVRAFLLALGVSKNPDMLLMVWRILQGLSIREVAMKYREQEAFSLTVTLARPGEEQDVLETYQTDDINDATLLGNFGITTVDGRPLFDGFFPDRRR